MNVMSGSQPQTQAQVCYFLYSWVLWGQQSLTVIAYHKGPLKFKLFAWKTYCKPTCSWFMRRISTVDRFTVFVPAIIQCLLFLSYQGQILFTRRVVKHWNRLLREAADSPSLEIFETKLGMTLSWWKVEAGLLWVGAEPSRKPFLPKSL